MLAVAAGTLGLTTATAAAVAVDGPGDVVKRVLTEFGDRPDTAVGDLGVLHDPQLVAQFETETGIFAIWVATSSSGAVCFAYSDAQWDGQGSPAQDQLDYGCGGEIYVGPDRPPEELTRPDQVGGFFKDDAGPLVYGVSPYPEAATVHVQGRGVDRLLPVREDSGGYGAAVPEAAQATAVTLTFLDADGRELGSKRSVAPVG